MREAIYFRSSLPQMQICVQTANAYVLDSLVPVIVYTVGLLAAGRGRYALSAAFPALY